MGILLVLTLSKVLIYKEKVIQFGYILQKKDNLFI